MSEFTVKLYAPDGALVFVGHLKPDQFSISHYPDRPTELDIHRAALEENGLLASLQSTRISRLPEESE